MDNGTGGPDMSGEDGIAMEPRTRRAASRAGVAELAERVARLETTVEHLQTTLARIEAGMGKMQVKLDGLAGTMAQGVGGLRVGVVLGQVIAAVAGFVAAHVWPMGK
jgi:uncharacterized coiled-coil protein SlyX